MRTPCKQRLRLPLFRLLIASVILIAIDGGSTLAQIIDLELNQQDLRLYGATDNDFTGQAVVLCDLNGDGRSDFVIGAHGFDYAGRDMCGIVYVLLSSDTLSPVIDLGASRPDLKRIIGPSSNSQLGLALSSGNINGDNFEDLVCGMPWATANGKFAAGQIAIMLGGASLPDTIDLASPAAGVIVIDGENVFDKLGSSVAVGDVDNDTFEDIAAGAPYSTTPGGFSAGKTYIIFGASSLPARIDLASPASPVTQILGEIENATFGASCAVADVTGDSYADVIAGAPQTTLPQRSNAGAVYVIPGDSSLPDTIDVSLVTQGLKRIYGEAADDLAGSAVATGNVTGSAIKDILLSAPDHSLPMRDGSGVVYAIPGSSTLPDTIDLMWLLMRASFIHGPEAGDAAGLSLASADMNADGFDEVIIGAPLASPPGRTEAGKVFLVFGRSELPIFMDLVVPQTGITTVYGATVGERTGSSLAVGNVNGDVFDDLLIGARHAESPLGIPIGAANLIIGDNEITPVQLVSYEARALAEGAELYWEVLDDVDSDAFLVERIDEAHRVVTMPDEWIRQISIVSFLFTDRSAEPAKTYNYRVYAEGEFLFSAEVRIPSAAAHLLHNFPNPFRDETSIRFSIPETGRVGIRIYDALGGFVTSVADRAFEGGTNAVTWNGRSEEGRVMPSGVYFLKMTYNGRSFYRKIVVLK